MDSYADNTSMLFRPPAALIIGHPGHELRVHGWMAQVCPTVFVVTDGSGTTGASRLESSSRTLREVGASRGEIYGHFSDPGIYAAMMDRAVAPLLVLVDKLADGLLERGVQVVVSDANEGFNPTHDLCREMTCAAVKIVLHRTGRSIPHYEFLLTEWETGALNEDLAGCRRVELSTAALEAKLEACRAYPELRDEVVQALEANGPEYFRTEEFRRSRGWTPLDEELRPQYELWGEQRVASGKYPSVLRFREHILPVFRALREHCAAVRESAYVEYSRSA